MCELCKKAGGGDCKGFDDLGVPGPPNSYLCSCPSCGALWMGNGYMPQIMYELTPAEADELFPNWQEYKANPARRAEKRDLPRLNPR